MTALRGTIFSILLFFFLREINYNSSFILYLKKNISIIFFLLQTSFKLLRVGGVALFLSQKHYIVV